MEIASSLIGGLIVIWPVWRIFARAGLNPAWSLLIFVPVLGWLAASALLALSWWPSVEPPPPDRGGPAP